MFGLRQRLGLTRAACAVGAVGARFDLETGLDPGAIATLIYWHEITSRMNPLQERLDLKLLR